MSEDERLRIPAPVEVLLAGEDVVPVVVELIVDEDAVLTLKVPDVEVLSPLPVVGGITGPGASEIPEGSVREPVGVTIPGMLSTVSPPSALFMWGHAQYDM